jgi:hypothetical protein
VFTEQISKVPEQATVEPEVAVEAAAPSTNKKIEVAYNDMDIID